MKQFLKNSTLLLLAFFFVYSHSALSETVEREWQVMKSANLYEYEISQKNGFQSKDLLKTGSTQKPRFRINLGPGVYFYRIRALTKAGQPSPWSTAAKIFVKGPKVHTLSPLKNEVIEVPEGNSELIFEWKTVVGAQYYILRVKNKESVKSHKVFIPRVIVPLSSQGSFQYKVEAYNGVNPISQSSYIPFRLKFSSTPPPRILEPRDSHVLPAYEPFPLRWVQRSPSRWSEVSVTRLDDSKKVISVEKIEASENHQIQALDPGHYQIAVRNYLDDSGSKYTQSAVTVKVELNPNSLTRPQFGFEARLLGGLMFGWNAYRSHLDSAGWLSSRNAGPNPAVHGRIKFPIKKNWGAELGIHYSDSRLEPKEELNFGGYQDESFKETQYYLGPTYKCQDLGPTKPVLLKAFLFFSQTTPIALNPNTGGSGSFNNSGYQEFFEQFWGLSAAAEMRWFGWHPKWDLITEHRLDFYFVSQGSTFGQKAPNFLIPSLRSNILIRRKLGSDLRLLLGGELFMQSLKMVNVNFESNRSVAVLGVRLGLQFEL